VKHSPEKKVKKWLSESIPEIDEKLPVIDEKPTKLKKILLDESPSPGPRRRRRGFACFSLCWISPKVCYISAGIIAVIVIVAAITPPFVILTHTQSE
jgi:hypothetical protein